MAASYRTSLAGHTHAVQAYRQAIATANSKKDKLSAHTNLGNPFQSVGGNISALTLHQTVRRVARLCLPWLGTWKHEQR